VRNELISGVAMLLFGILMLVVIIPTEIVEGGDYTISPALLPKICAIGITALAALNIVKAVRRMQAGETSVDAGRPMPWGPALAALATVVAGILIFRYLHPAPAVLLMVAALMAYMGERRWLLLIGLPIGLLITGYLLFYQVLGLVVA